MSEFVGLDVSLKDTAVSVRRDGKRVWRGKCASDSQALAALRALLYEAATTILTRVYAESALRTWGLKLREKVGFKRATIAVARKLAVIMHSMLKTGRPFDRAAGAAA